MAIDIGSSGVFDTTDSVPRSEGKVRPYAALKRLARKMNVELKFSIPWNPRMPSPEPGEIHSRFAPESKYNVSKEGRRIKQAVTEKVEPVQVGIGGTTSRWRKTESVVPGTNFRKSSYVSKGLEEMKLKKKEFVPSTRVKAMRPGGLYGKQWTTIEQTDVQPGEQFKLQPVFERRRLDWDKYLRAQSGGNERLYNELWNKHQNAVIEENAGERLGVKELKGKTILRIQGQMQRHRDYMAGELKESKALIRAKNSSLESAAAHPERMTEYKGRLSAVAAQRQASAKTARTRAAERLRNIAQRGINVVAEEHTGDWQSQLEKLNKNLKAATSPEEENNIRKQIHEHWILKKGPEEIKSQARGMVGVLTDKPYEHGGTPLSQVSSDTIQDVFQKGTVRPWRTTHKGKLITPAERIKKLKGHLDAAYERSASSGLGDIKSAILKETRDLPFSRSRVFGKEAKSVAQAGYPYLGKLGLGIGAAGLLAGGALAVHAARKYSKKHELQSRLRDIRFELPGPAEKALTDYAKRIFAKAAKTGMSTSSNPIPGTISEALYKPLSTYQGVRQKWEKMVKALGGSKIQDLNPIDMKGLRALQKTNKQNLDTIKTLRSQLRTREHIGEEALKTQAEKLGAEHAKKEKDLFNKGHKVGREEQSVAERAAWGEREKALAGRYTEESNKRASRLKWIGAGTLGVGALGGYALGRHDRNAYQRHEARQILDAYRPRQPRQQSNGNRPMLTIGISANGGRRKNFEFSAIDNIRDKLAGPPHEYDYPAHDIAIGAIEGGLTFPASAWAASKLLGKNPSLGRKMLVGGGVGGAATGLVGLGLSNILRGTRTLKREKQQRKMSSKSKLIQFQQMNQRTLVARDRYVKQIHERDVDRANKYYIRTGLLGAGIGALLSKKNLSKSILTGAGIGVGAQKLARMYGNTTRDQFGDRSIEGKRIERVPSYAGTALLAGVGLKKLAGFKKFCSSLKLVQFDEPNDDGPEWLQKWAHKKLYGRDYNTMGQAQRVKKYAGRTHRIIRDLNIKRQGLPNIDARGRPRKNEWEKPWVAGALTTAGLAASIYGLKKGVKFMNKAPLESRWGQLKEGFMRGEGAVAEKVPGLQKVGQMYHGVMSDLKRWRDKPLTGPLKYEHSKFNQVTGKMKTEAQIAKETSEKSTKDFLESVASGKKYKEEFRSRLREIHFQSEKHPGEVASGLGTAGFIAGGLYRGMPLKKNEDIVGRRVIRSHRRYPLLQHEGIGIPGGKVVEVKHTPSMGKKAEIVETSLKGFGKGGRITIVDKPSRNAARRAIRQVGKTICYGPASNCQTVGAKVVKGVRRALPRQLKAALTVGGLSAAAGYVGDKAFGALEFGARTLKGGQIVRWGKNLPEAAKSWTGTTSGIMEIRDPHTNTLVHLRRTTRPWGEPGEGGKWWQHKNWVVDRLYQPKSMRKTMEGGRSLAGLHDVVFPHADKAKLNMSTVASAYRNTSPKSKMNATTDLVNKYQKRGFKLDSSRLFPTEWSFPMSREPGASRQPLSSTADIQKYVDTNRKRDIKRGLRMSRNKIGELGKAAAAPALGIAGATVAGKTIASDEDSKTHKAMIAGGGALAGIGATQIPKLYHTAKKAGPSLVDNMYMVGNTARIKIGKRMINNPIGKFMVKDLVKAYG